MIDATISENGKQEITGRSLNLALTEIVNNMGSGGGGLMLHWLPRPEIESLIDGQYPEYPFYDKLQECIDHNIEIYNILVDCNRNHTHLPGPIYFDTTFFEWFYNHRENSLRGGIAASWRIYDNDENPIVYITSLASNEGTYGEEEALCSDGLFGNNAMPE